MHVTFLLVVLALVSAWTTAQSASAQARAGAQPPAAAVARQPEPAMVTENVVYAFAPGKIAIIEPRASTIVKELTEGLAHVDWGDPVVTPDNRLMFVNERASARVFVIDTAQQQIVKRIDVGPRPVHIYHPNKGREIWSHSDEEGAFYVINIDSLEVTGKVVAALQGTGHGKLLYHRSLGSKAYATNTNDPAVFVIDRATKQMTKTIALCDGQGGTHGKAYSALSKHAYFECSAIGKTAVVDTRTDTLVKYLDGSGQIFTSPDERVVLVVNKRAGKLHVIDATRGSAAAAAIPVEGGPDKVAFHQQDGRLLAFTANTLTPDTAVVDLRAMKVVKRVPAGDIKRPEGARFLHRGGEIGGGFYVTPASGDGLVAIIDATHQVLHGTVRLEGADGVAFVGARGR